jgi:hypothetical protein
MMPECSSNSQVHVAVIGNESDRSNDDMKTLSLSTTDTTGKKYRHEYRTCCTFVVWSFMKVLCSVCSKNFVAIGVIYTEKKTVVQ